MLPRRRSKGGKGRRALSVAAPFELWGHRAAWGRVSLRAKKVVVSERVSAYNLEWALAVAWRAIIVTEGACASK